jgi:hypothetical protein
MPEAFNAGGAGANTFHKFTALKTAKDRFVGTPNNVMIDAYGPFNGSREPAVIVVPSLAVSMRV